MGREREPQFGVYLPSDIENILMACDASNAELCAALPMHGVAIYRAGFQAALKAVAAGVGVDYQPERPAPLPRSLLPSVLEGR